LNQINSAERIESISRRVRFIWPSAKLVPAVRACW